MTTRKQGIKEGVQKFFGINASMLSMLFMVIVLGLGEKMGERFLPVYIIALGGSAYAVGFLNAMDNFLSAIYSYIGGYFSDLLGYKRALKLYTIISLVGYAIIILFPVWQAVIIGAIFFISWTALSLPAILSMVSATVKKEKQTMGVSLHSLIKRVPMSLGPIMGGVLITTFGITVGSRIAFGIAFILGIFAIWFIERYIEAQKTEKSEPTNAIRTFNSMSKPLKTLLLSDMFIRFAEQLPYAFVVVWVMEINKLSAVSFSIFTLIEMVTAMLIYIPVALLNEKTSSKWIVSMTFIFFTIFPTVLMFSKTFWMLCFAFVIRGLKEFGEPTRKALIVKLAPEGSKASTFGTYYLFRDVVVAVVSLASAWLWNISPEVNFIVASSCGLIGTLIFMIYGKDEQHERPT